MTDDGTTVPLGVSVGDRVLFGSYAGTEVKSEGKEYLILDVGEILAVVDDKPWSGRARKTKASKAKGRKRGSKK